MGRFANFVSRLTGDSTSKASRAGHDFRDHSGARQGRERDSSREKAPKWASQKTKSGVPFFPKGRGSKD